MSNAYVSLLPLVNKLDIFFIEMVWADNKSIFRKTSGQNSIETRFQAKTRIGTAFLTYYAPVYKPYIKKIEKYSLNIPKS